MDNLKLGYGGTQAEMKRLLADAEKLTGKTYDMSKFGDIVEAIHAIQEEMGITGTTAKEASETISGSLGMVKSAWKNLVAGMGKDNADFSKLIDNLVDSAFTVQKNLMPRVKKIFKGITELIKRAAPMIVKELPKILKTVLPDLMAAAADTLKALIGGLNEGLKTLPELAELGLELMLELVTAMADNLPRLIPTLVDVILQIAQNLINHAGELLKVGLEFAKALVLGISNSLPIIVEALPGLVLGIIDWVADNIDLVFEIGVQIMEAIGVGLSKAIPNLIMKIPEILEGLWTGVVSISESIIGIGAKILIWITDGLQGDNEDLKNFGWELYDKLVPAVKEKWQDYKDLGWDLADEILNGANHGILYNTQSYDFGWQLYDYFEEEVERRKNEFIHLGEELSRRIKTGFMNDVQTIENWGWDLYQAIYDKVSEKFTNFYNIGKEIVEKIKNGFQDAWNGVKDFLHIGENKESKVDGSHRNGLSYVPYDNYIAQLHKGERVLTAEENRGYNGHSGVNITQNINAVPQTPVEIAAATEAYFREAMWI